MTSPPCGPISLHLKVTLPSSNIHCCPLMAVLQHVHRLHPDDKEGRNGQWVWNICPSRDSCPGYNGAACWRLLWWGPFRCWGAIAKQTAGATFHKYNCWEATDAYEQKFVLFRSLEKFCTDFVTLKMHLLMVKNVYWFSRSTPIHTFCCLSGIKSFKNTAKISWLHLKWNSKNRKKVFK